MEGSLFFALKGPHFNGNRFAAAALEQGAAYAVIDDPAFRTDERCILVDDVLTALQQLARHHRDQLNIPVLAITGSNGKTTTKELCRAVLGTAYRTYATEGNLNNHIGVPLTLLRIPAGTEIAIVEMGANHLREIASYCLIANPTHGLITNCGKAHLEGFGGIEGVRRGKGELFDHLRATGGSAFVCRDFGYLREMSHDIREIYWYGTGEDVQLSGSIRENTLFLHLSTSYTGPIATRLVGDYNLYNALAAIAVGKYFRVPPEKAREALEQYLPANQRSQVIHEGSNTLVLDAYNANPTSMKAAVENFAALKGSRKVLLLGAMMELGADSLAEHRELVRLIGQYPWLQVVLVGGDFARVDHPYLFFPDAEAAGTWYRQQHFENTALLIKGSRSIAMEKIIR
ncbi:UDP-N-acetylmuramoyl-tripeptide--D-alanyl-D-alanine ligase [Compostibacter hankyongensis]|uniref:UDP-N-acetylmuramoyl-tripeptide--D-alanyl-D-alanine ligase n=1 Tax=Compostibacter hankyongensis TaxID=1007089 RepID=A0ABP8FIE2_9BACT